MRKRENRGRTVAFALFQSAGFDPVKFGFVELTSPSGEGGAKRRMRGISTRDPLQSTPKNL